MIFLPDFIVPLHYYYFRRLDCSVKKLFDYPGSITNVNYFSFFGFSASRLSSSLVVVLPGVLIFSFCFVPLVLKPRFNLRNMRNKK